MLQALQLPVWVHAVFESMAYATGFALYNREKAKSGDFLPRSDRSSVIVAAVVGAAIGSKVLGWFEQPAELASHWASLTWLLGGKTIVGGLLGGTIAVEWVKRRMGVQRRTGDLFAIPIAIAIAVGRLGCFFAGLEDHTYGVATTLPWGVDFGDGIPRHPTQLYEICFLLALALLLRGFARYKTAEGDLFRAFLFLYSLWRVAIDFLKPDPRIWIFSAIQWASLAAVIWYSQDALRIASALLSTRANSNANTAHV